MSEQVERRARGKWVAIAVIVTVIAGVAYYGSRHSSESHASVPKSVAITYKVHGTARITDVTYTTPSGIGQQNDIDVPIVKKSDKSEGIVVQMTSGSPVVLSAQNKRDSGDIECIIEGSDGAVIASNKSSGGFAIASCSGVAR